ncbi:MAG: NADH-quinone oxidoreductase subunit C [Candidatus Omnitrophica bacterium]|nr:NADH-quinone oxidoreductase subunit C [Candidatus Omnitrophota bacterium]
MDCAGIISEIKKISPRFCALSSEQSYPDEVRIKTAPRDFKDACLALHKAFSSPVMMLYALDERKRENKFAVNCVFLNSKDGLWVTVKMDIPKDDPRFESLARDIHSASLFEREIWEMFGIEPKGNPDLRRLRLHDEVCPQGNYPLRKDFVKIEGGKLNDYKFNRVEGEGVFEVPVGPVHAGIIPPGHFRFSVAGEPIINLEIRLGFIHRGVEKLFEGRSCPEAVRIAASVSGDSNFAHSLAFINAAEKIMGLTLPRQALYLRAIFLELERMYNHVNDIGGMATDVGFSFPAAFASIIKEAILQLNEKLTGSRYLKGVNNIGGVSTVIEKNKKDLLLDTLEKVMADFKELDKMLSSSDSFMDRVDSAGVLRRKTAEDLGIVGLPARASGIAIDLREHFPGVYREAKFNMALRERGDVLARFRIRVSEFEGSARLIKEFLDKINPLEKSFIESKGKAGEALGYAEGWRGPVLYSVKTDASGLIERCKIVDPSFHNWQGLSYAVLENIIPDFPLCNKSFNLSYPGNDL